MFVNKENLVENIKKCWASLFGERAIYYRLKNKFTKEIAVAVVVQAMMSSEFSGVAFSNFFSHSLTSFETFSTNVFIFVI